MRLNQVDEAKDLKDELETIDRQIHNLIEYGSLVKICQPTDVDSDDYIAVDDSAVDEALCKLLKARRREIVLELRAIGVYA